MFHSGAHTCTTTRGQHDDISCLMYHQREGACSYYLENVKCRQTFVAVIGKCLQIEKPVSLWRLIYKAGNDAGISAPHLMLLRADHDVPSLQRDQVVRSHQGVRRDPLAPLDRPLPSVLALQVRPVSTRQNKNISTIQCTVIQSIHGFIDPLIMLSTSWSYPLSLETKISLNSRETIFSLETRTTT